MNDLISTYQFAIVIALCVWVIPLVSAWVRYDILPHSLYAFICIFVAPVILLNDVLVAFEVVHLAPYLISAFWFAPTLVTILCFLSTQKMLLEKPGKPILHLLVAGLFIIAEIPFLLASSDAKIALVTEPVIGGFFEHWMFYSYHILSAIIIVVYSILAMQNIRQYELHLSEHVVDISFYRFGSLSITFAILSAIGMTGLITVLLVAFNLLPIEEWQTGLAVLYSLILCLVVMSSVEKRRYAPSPLDYKELAEQKYPDEFMQGILSKAEKAMIKHKAYRKKGLRLRQLCNAAEVEPLELAVASRALLNRNFRAFVYHYRLEYAKLLLTRTDIKVSTVAKRLGFDSEKYLSDIFVKYIRNMGQGVDPEGG